MKFSPFEATYKTAIGAFILLAAITLAEPSYAYGLSVGFWIVLVMILIAIPVAFAAMVWNLIFGSGKKWSLEKTALYVILVVVSGAFLHVSLMIYADRTWGLGDSLIQNKIEYFCLRHFNHHQCVSNVNLCPLCAHKIVRWKRLEMAKKLREYTAAHTPPGAAPVKTH